jgi:hypothetical protein
MAEIMALVMSVMGPCYPGGLQVQPGWINLALTWFHRVAFGNGNGNGNGGIRMKEVAIHATRDP